MSDTEHPAPVLSDSRSGRYRLNRAGIHNVWHYDDHIFQFADGRLLLRGRNGAGKSKALEMLLPFLLDGDARRLDTTGTSRTSLRWLMLEGRYATEDPPAADGATENDGPAGEPTTTIGYVWVEFVGRDEEGDDRWRTLGAAITATSTHGDARPVFFVTDRRVGVDLAVLNDGYPLPIERLRDEVGDENCYETAVTYRARVMRELFGLDDPMRYRNLVHLLYRLRRPTIGERIEAGELVSVLSEALPPMDETVLDTVARNLSDLDAARARLTALRSAHERVSGFLTDYRRYVRDALASRAHAAREQLDGYTRRTAEVERLESELESLLAAESQVQERRDRLRRTRDTAEADATTLESCAAGTAERETADHHTRDALVSTHIRAAETAGEAAEHAIAAERQAQERITADVTALTHRLTTLRSLHHGLGEVAAAAGVDLTSVTGVPHPDTVTLAPRESRTQVNLEGLEQAVERAPVMGIDEASLRRRLATLHDQLTGVTERVAERERAAAALRERAAAARAAAEHSRALDDEAEWADHHLHRARERENEALERVRAASADYAAAVREWGGRLREAAPEHGLEASLAELERRVELPLDSELRALDGEIRAEVAEQAHHMVVPLLSELRDRRDTTVGEQRELTTELDELSERRSDLDDHIAAPRPAWASAPRDPGAGTPLYLAIDFVDSLDGTERAGLEAALEASGLLSAWLTPDGELLDETAHDVLLSADTPAPGEGTLLDVLSPQAVPDAGVSVESVTAVLGSIRLMPAATESGTGPATAGEPSASTMVSLDGRWRLGATRGAYVKSAPEYIGVAARTQARDRQLEKVDRRIAIAEALLAEADERRGDLERQHDTLVEIMRDVPDGSELVAAWRLVDTAREGLAAASRDATAATTAADTAREEAARLREEVHDEAARSALPATGEELAATLAALERLRDRLATAYRDLETLAGHLEAYRGDVAEWQRLRADRIAAEDARAAAIQKMITTRREIELTDRARSAAAEQLDAAGREVRERHDEAAAHVPELEREAQRARDDRVAAETRHEVALSERAEQARRVLAAGAELRAPLGEATADSAFLRTAGLAELADTGGSLTAYDAALGDPEAPLDRQVQAVADLTDAVEERVVSEDGATVDDTTLLGRHGELHHHLTAADSIGARAELSEPSGIKRVTVHDDEGSHDITDYADRLHQAIAAAEETALLREEEAFERHLLGELAGHLSQQIEEARALIRTMNDVLGEVTTSQGLGVRLDWHLAPDAGEDINAVVPLLERPPEERTRVETTRLRDALRRCIEAIRQLDPSAGQGAQLRAALDYRAWFSFSVYVTDSHGSQVERRLTRRTALSQGEQRVIAYLVLFAAAAAQFGSLARHARQAPRLILLDDAFAKVDEPTHGRLLGLLVELDLDFVLTSERLWGCFESVPSLHIYECLRDSTTPGIATLHFTWNGHRRRMVGF